MLSISDHGCLQKNDTSNIEHVFLFDNSNAHFSFYPHFTGGTRPKSSNRFSQLYRLHRIVIIFIVTLVPKSQMGNHFEGKAGQVEGLCLSMKLTL